MIRLSCRMGRRLSYLGHPAVSGQMAVANEPPDSAVPGFHQGMGADPPAVRLETSHHGPSAKSSPQLSTPIDRLV